MTQQIGRYRRKCSLNWNRSFLDDNVVVFFLKILHAGWTETLFVLVFKLGIFV